MPYANPDSPEAIAAARASRRKWYRENKERQIARQLERREERRKWLWNYKRTLSCADCGMSFADRPECLDFHHNDPEEKDGSVSAFINHSEKRMMEEIEKCIPLCANCHRTRHKDMFTYA